MTLQAGDRVDLAQWAYAYRKGAADNPVETQWLWPIKRFSKGANGAWRYDDARDLFPREKVLCACLWEESRHIRQVEVEFNGAGDTVPNAGEITIVGVSSDSLWSDRTHCFFGLHEYRQSVFMSECDPLLTPQGSVVFNFSSDNFAPGFASFQRLFVVYNGSCGNVCLPSMHAYGASKWREPLSVDIEWGLETDHASTLWSGRAEIYNGITDGIQPLEAGNGIAVAGQAGWKEGAGSAARRGITLRLFHSDDSAEDRSIVTLWTTGGDFSFTIPDIEQGPVLIPGLGVCAFRRGTGITGRQFQAQLAASGKKTTRQQVNAHGEQDVSHAMAAFKIDASPGFPEPPYEPVMKVNVPDPYLNGQWRVGAWHLKRWTSMQQDGSCLISLWPFKDIEDMNGSGIAVIGEETFQIIRTLDLMGLHDVAEGGLKYWLSGKKAAPCLWHAETLGNDALCHADNSYDQKHGGGGGKILETAGFHYLLTGDEAWLEKSRPELEKACDWIIALRKKWMGEIPEGHLCHGLMPPGEIGDGSETCCFFYVSLAFYSGLRQIAQLLGRKGWDVDGHYQQEADAFHRDLRRACERAIARMPVVKAGDGSYRRCISTHPYKRHLGGSRQQKTMSSLLYANRHDLGKAFRSFGKTITAWHGQTSGKQPYLPFGSDEVLSGLQIVPDIFGPRDLVTQEMMDVYEDLILADKLEAAEGLDAAGSEAWFSLNGYSYQNGHAMHIPAYLHLDDVPLFLRALCNGYASNINPNNGYTFQEHAHTFWYQGPPDKTFEEAAFLERFRNLLVMEEGQTLWLARAIPRAWLEQGKTVSVKDAPTHFGAVDYEIASDVANGRITAIIAMPGRNPAKEVWLRLRHPGSATIRRVAVNGRPWPDFDPAKEVVQLQDLKGRVTVDVQY